MKNLYTFLSAVLCLLLCACSADRFSFDRNEYAGSAENELLKLAVAETLDKIYPEKFTMRHRVVFSATGREQALSGCLFVDRKKGFRGLGFDDMGIKIFDFVLEDGQLNIQKKPPEIPEEVIRQGIAEDISSIYMPQGAGTKDIFMKTESPGISNLVLSYGNENYRIYEAASGAKIFPLKITTVSSGKIIREIELSDYRKIRDTFQAARISVKNKQFNYEFEIELLEFKKEVPDASVFSKL